MFSLFNPPFNRDRTPIVLPMFDYLIKQTQHEVTKVVDFYQQNIYHARTTDRLVKLLIELQSFMDLSPENLVNTVRNNTARLCNAYNIVSPINNAKITNQGEMYNRNNPELFIFVEYPFGVKKCVDNYKALKPVRVVSHDFTDFGYGLANGAYQSQETGIAIFTIDIALLALQYQQWFQKERYIKERNYHLPTTHFVVKYIWTGLLSTHMDNVIFNRLLNRLKKQPSAPSRTPHSFYTVDYGDRFDATLDQLIARYQNQPSDWLQRMNSIPSLEYGSYFKAVSYPDTAPTRQIKWAMVLSKLKMVEFLLLTDGYDQNTALNLTDREAIARELRILRNDRSLELFVPQTVLSRIERVYDEVNKE